MTQRSMVYGLIVLTSTVVSAELAADQTSTDERINLSRQVAGEFMRSLQAELQAAMKAGGPVNALDVCNTKAEAVAETYSRKPGWRVARTSLKPRNPKNTPDAWERTVLDEFEARHRSGESLEDMEQQTVVGKEGLQVFRWMKAIPTRPVCLTCHGGGEVSSDVERKLRELYPRDQARGYKIGDIRGAFTISQTMD